MPDLDFNSLVNQFSGELYFNDTPSHNAQKLIYSTDASVYQEKPLAVAIPRNKEDIKAVIQFANENHLTIIPRAAGTSLAGQVVGSGMVVDISKHLNAVITFNKEERWVKVQPGIIRDDLNAFLRPHGLMYAPETSTASRAMIGGMIGNNSCGLHSIVWGDSRRHLLEATVFLADGSEVLLSNFSSEEVKAKSALSTLEGKIYKGLDDLLSNRANAENIVNGFPKKSLTRRNTGYALDILLEEYERNNGGFNLCHLFAGSEGTLGFLTEAKLNLIPVPPVKDAVVCVHCHSIAEALHANNVALEHYPMASELVDKFIMDFTKGHPVYHKNRFFIEGEPEALLMVEFMEDDDDKLQKKTSKLVAALRDNHIGYAWPIVKGPQTKLVWDVRKAGLGLIRNLPGDSQPVNLIEDCAVTPQQLPDYIADLQDILKKHQLQASYYAHAGAGELHVEPMINLKSPEGKDTFRTVLKETVALVKKYNGSLSGEHGDGRLRGEFIPDVLGSKVFQLLKQVKGLFDPYGVFNDRKIINTPPMNEYLRYNSSDYPKQIQTIFDFSHQEGILRLAEKCSGSGDCRKTHITGGTMCPSYMATRMEKDTTRARANMLRQFLTKSDKENPFDYPEIKEVMDLCLSCKACKSECPSAVDVAKMKAEFLQHYYDEHGVPFRTWLIGNFTKTQQLAVLVPGLYNAIVRNKFLSDIVKGLIGFAKDRSLPEVGKTTLRKWHHKRKPNQQKAADKKLWLFCDEFTNYNDLETGQKAILLLEALGYEVVIPEHLESGRTYLSKGLVRKARELINKNVASLSKIVTAEAPLIGIEPSAIHVFRDEALDLTPPELRPQAVALAKNCFLIEEFLLSEFKLGKIAKDAFTENNALVKLHGHCYQKSYGLVDAVKDCLSIPLNYRVELIPSGCCGMAGAFGFEKEHYEVSMKVAELVLLPEIRKQEQNTIIAASGTSCRHQVKDGTQVKALHPVEILFNALKLQNGTSL